MDEALAVAAQMADALEAAHAKGIIRRDLKPANIAFTAVGAHVVQDISPLAARDRGELAGGADAARANSMKRLDEVTTA